jgi:hypothetical protein
MHTALVRRPEGTGYLLDLAADDRTVLMRIVKELRVKDWIHPVQDRVY